MLPFKHVLIQREANGPPGGAPPAPPPAAPPPAPPPPPAAPPPAPAPAGSAKTYEDWLADPVNAEYTKKLRSENAENRVKATTATKNAEATLREFAKSLGIEIPGGDPLDPAKLNEELGKTRRENLELKLGNALEQASRKHGADPELLVPYLRGSGALEKLDPTAETFGTDVSALVKTLLEKNPKLKAAQVAPRSGGEFPGGKPQVQQLTREQLQQMYKAGQHEEIQKAREAGQLDQVMRGGV